MKKETKGEVVSVSKQWWLKINTKPVRLSMNDGAIYPHIIKIAYTVDGTAYTKRKWIKAGRPVPSVGAAVKLIYDEDRPNKAEVVG